MLSCCLTGEEINPLPTSGVYFLNGLLSPNYFVVAGAVAFGLDPFDVMFFCSLLNTLILFPNLLIDVDFDCCWLFVPVSIFLTD
jgi:hypothetical protein